MSQTGTTASHRNSSAGRTVLIAVVSLVGYAIGFYVGFFVLLSIVSLESFEGWQYPLATVPAGALFAGVGASLASPDTGRVWKIITGAALVAGFAWMLVMYAIDGGFEAALVVGGIVCAAVATTAAYLPHRRAGLD